MRARSPGNPAIRDPIAVGGRLASVQPLLTERRNAYVPYVRFEPGLHRKVPGLFVFLRPAGAEEGWGPFRFPTEAYAGDLRNTFFRVRIPGGVPGLPRKRNASAPLRHGDRMKRNVL